MRHTIDHLRRGGKAAVCVLAAMLALAASAAGDATFALRVASYNVRCGTKETDSTNNWDNRKADLVNLVKSIAPDVIGFQEVDPGHMSYLKSNLPEYEIFGKHREANNTLRATPVGYLKSKFIMLYSGTFWLSTTPDVQGSRDLGDGYVSTCPETCSWAVLCSVETGCRFCIMSTHLDHMNAELRRRNMRVLLSKVQPFLDAGLPIIVVGDMNALETEDAILDATAVMQDSFLYSNTVPAGPWRTYNAFTWKPDEASNAYALANYTAAERSASGSVLGGTRIDYIFSSPGTVVESFATRNDARPGKQYYPSDHYPVVADLVISCENNFYSGKVKVEIDRSIPHTAHGRYVLTSGAKLVDDRNLEFVLPKWVERAAVEDGEIVIYTRPEPMRLVFR